MITLRLITPSGIGYQPSPGLNAGGEGCDLEEFYVRMAGQQLQFLIVTSTPGMVTMSGQNFYMGDLFIQTADHRYGIVSQSENQGLAVGGIYRIDQASDTESLQQLSRSYYSYTGLYENDYGDPAMIRDIVGPWAVSDDISDEQLLGMAEVSMATFDYGDSEDGTWVYQFAIEAALLGLPDDLQAHVGWGCGNDVIRVQMQDTPPVPEPATMAMLGLGLGFILARRRLRRVAQ